MATVLLFHHALGQTPGFFAFADGLRSAGYTVHTPDLFDGKTFATIEDGVAHVEQIGFQENIRRGSATADALPPDIVYAGFSLGVLPAQSLAQTPHYFADPSCRDYDERAAGLLMERALKFLRRVDE